MEKQEILEKIQDLGLLAVIRGSSAAEAVNIVDALVAGGVIGIEIAFTTPDALSAVKRLDKKYGQKIVLGMGTLTKPEHASAAQQAGAQFMVSPHTEEKLAAAMTQTGLPFMMGALTPSEVFQSFSLGSDIVKLFPGSLGGVGYLKSLRGPFPDIPIMPTGGVSLENMKDWFAAGAFAVGVGSGLFPKVWVQQGRFDDISERAEEFCRVLALNR